MQLCRGMISMPAEARSSSPKLPVLQLASGRLWQPVPLLLVVEIPWCWEHSREVGTASRTPKTSGNILLINIKELK